MAEATQAKAAAGEGKKDRNRSFSYPAFSLPEIIEKARVLHQKDGANWIPPKVASEHWGFSPKSSGGIRAVAALAHFGLIEEQGSKDTRRVRLNPRARTILLAPPEREQERAEAIRQAALTPKSYQTLWAKHHGKLPSDAVLRYDLESEGGMNEQVIKEFIKDFKATVQFAKLTESANLGEDEGTRDESKDSETLDLGDGRPPRQPKGGNPPMPELQHAGGGQPIDLPIPLAGGLRAILRVPAPLTEDNFKRLTENLATMLGLWKPNIVGDDDPNGK